MDEDTRTFLRSFQRLLDGLHELAPPADRGLFDRFAHHLGVDPATLPVLVADYPAYDHANLQTALDRWLEFTGQPHELVGLAGRGHWHMSLSEIVDSSRRHGAYGIGSVDYARVAWGVDREMDCIRFGFLLARSGDDRLVVLVRSAPRNEGGGLALEIIGTSPSATDALLVDLRRLMTEHNVFRRQVVSLDGSPFEPNAGGIRFHPRPAVDRADVILPDGVLDLVERQVVGIARHRARMLAEGQHLKRGILLYGPPGTGKTHTARYLSSRLSDFTVVLLTGSGIGLVGEACTLARHLEPALVVLEDCDLVAQERSHRRGNPLLFEVLDQMDGLAPDADVAFVLTTNRADLLEPALAQRPGRVDVAVEIELPDAAARGRLFGLYGGRLADAATTDLVVGRTEGVTASFLKELVRRAILVAAERGAADAGRADVETALDEMLATGDRLARALVGGGAERLGPAVMTYAATSPFPAPGVYGATYGGEG